MVLAGAKSSKSNARAGGTETWEIHPKDRPAGARTVRPAPCGVRPSRTVRGHSQCPGGGKLNRGAPARGAWVSRLAVRLGQTVSVPAPSSSYSFELEAVAFEAFVEGGAA